jgi:hypothetical protein
VRLHQGRNLNSKGKSKLKAQKAKGKDIISNFEFSKNHFHIEEMRIGHSLKIDK